MNTIPTACCLDALGEHSKKDKDRDTTAEQTSAYLAPIFALGVIFNPLIRDAPLPNLDPYDRQWKGR